MDFEEEIREELEREDTEGDHYAGKDDDKPEEDDDISAVEEGFMKGYEDELSLDKQKDPEEESN